jgi:hypothetical protein
MMLRREFIRKRIVQLLTDAAGEKLSVVDICARLKIEIGKSGAPYRNLCNVVGHVAILRETGRIEYANPTADVLHILYWVEPPREDAHG